MTIKLLIQRAIIACVISFSYVLILIPDWSEQGVQSEVAVHSPTGPTVLLQGKLQAIISISLFRSYQIQSVILLLTLKVIGKTAGGQLQLNYSNVAGDFHR